MGIPLPQDKDCQLPQFVHILHQRISSMFKTARKKSYQFRVDKSTKVVKTGCSTLVITFGFMCIPAIRVGSTSFASLRKGPYTIIDKASPFNYKIELIVSFQQKIILANELKCATVSQIFISNQWKCPYLVMMYTHPCLMLGIQSPWPQQNWNIGQYNRMLPLITADYN